MLALLFDSGLALFGGVFIAAGGIILALGMEPGWTSVDQTPRPVRCSVGRRRR
jgi:hypothetical protein